ncbi:MULTISPECIES: LytR C-terminal domain-containing protein [Sphingomonas]|uniref:LytR C-terminal domain-containing protein n=1 Tax=Sphingomonas TaxID=13687 RepID=UPI000DEEB5AC|nr:MULTISPECIES: LytR C-terminal domain-containing protein [Sphingomonas]
MRVGGISVLVLLAGCAAQHPIAVRSVASSAAAVARPTGERIDYADGQLALGNVALALESYRRANRERPDSVAALVGMADCYDRMERFDLSQRYLQNALALRPTDRGLLTRLATSRERAGDTVGAAALRQEASVRGETAVTVALAPAPVAPPQRADLPPPASSVTVALLPPTPPELPERRTGPRLERLSLAEIALVTGPPVQWRDLAARPDEAPASIRILNAARAQGLAAQTRARLRQLGWRGMEIGDAPAVQAKTAIFYPAARRGTAERLGRQLGVAALHPATGGELVMLLGRDRLRAGSQSPR